MSDLISIETAAARGISRLRKPIWRMPEDHLKIDIINGRLGPWVHLYSPFNKECNGRDPVDMLVIDLDRTKPEFEPYSGPLPESDEYRKAVEQFDGCLTDQISPDAAAFQDSTTTT